MFYKIINCAAGGYVLSFYIEGHQKNKAFADIQKLRQYLDIIKSQVDVDADKLYVELHKGSL